jgi:hypothetical protein
MTVLAEEAMAVSRMLQTPLIVKRTFLELADEAEHSFTVKDFVRRPRALTDTNVCYGESELSTAAPSSAGDLSDKSDCELISDEELFIETDDEGSDVPTAFCTRNEHSAWQLQAIPAQGICWQVMTTIPSVGHWFPNSSVAANVESPAAFIEADMNKKNRRRSAFVAKKREERALRRAQRGAGIPPKHEIIIGNLPEHVTLEVISAMLDAEGLQGLYNSVHFSNSCDGRFALLNMMSPHVAALALQLLPAVRPSWGGALKVYQQDGDVITGREELKKSPAGPPGTWL